MMPGRSVAQSVLLIINAQSKEFTATLKAAGQRGAITIKGPKFQLRSRIRADERRKKGSTYYEKLQASQIVNVVSDCAILHDRELHPMYAHLTSHHFTDGAAQRVQAPFPRDLVALLAIFVPISCKMLITKWAPGPQLGFSYTDRTYLPTVLRNMMRYR
jgi:hypothetical protein